MLVFIVTVLHSIEHIENNFKDATWDKGCLAELVAYRLHLQREVHVPQGVDDVHPVR